MLRGTERGTFSAMTLFAWLAIGVGVGAMSSLLSVMYGFESTLKEKVLNAYPPILIGAKEGNVGVQYNPQLESQIANLPKVVRVLPYVQNEMILRAQRRSLGVVVWGLPLEQLGKLNFELKEGDWPSRLGTDAPAAVGSELANRLGLFPGERISFISPIGKTGPLGLIPQSQSFVVSGIFGSGHYEFDEQYAILGLEDAQELMGLENRITGWQVWSKSLEDVPEVMSKLQPLLPQELEAKSWETFNSALFQSLKLEQYSMFTILSFAIFISVMNVVITLTMNVAHKRKNIGILRALGASQKQIQKIFLCQGGFMGVVGLTIGAILTVGFVIYVKYFSQYQLPEIYYDRTVPIEMRPLSLVLIYGVATLLIYLATLYPASQASKMNVIESIRE